jgi:hypothetical protein
MARDFNGTNQYLSTASGPVTTVPLTIACWFYPDTITTRYSLVSINSSSITVTGFFYISARGDLAGDPIRISVDANGTAAVNSTTGFVANSWNHACGVFESNSSRTVYCNGGGSATSTASYTPSNIVLMNIGYFDTAATAYMDGRIAEVGVWNAALTAAEVESLADGMTCDKVRPQSLVFYAPLVRDLQDLRGGLTITNNNTATVATHPRVYA